MTTTQIAEALGTDPFKPAGRTIDRETLEIIAELLRMENEKWRGEVERMIEETKGNKVYAVVMRDKLRQLLKNMEAR